MRNWLHRLNSSMTPSDYLRSRPPRHGFRPAALTRDPLRLPRAPSRQPRQTAAMVTRPCPSSRASPSRRRSTTSRMRAGSTPPPCPWTRSPSGGRGRRSYRRAAVTTERRPACGPAPGDGRRPAHRAVLPNLFAKAARYSRESVPFHVTALRDGIDVAVSVTDEGRGLPPERLLNPP